jgi:hypothetical protein
MISLETTDKLTFKMEPKAVIHTGLVVHGFGRLPIQITGDFTDIPEKHHEIFMMAMLEAFPQKMVNDKPYKQEKRKSPLELLFNSLGFNINEK